MGLSKTEINLRRLLDAAPRQKNQTKLIHVSETPRLGRKLPIAPSPAFHATELLIYI